MMRRRDVIGELFVALARKLHVVLALQYLYFPQPPCPPRPPLSTHLGLIAVPVLSVLPVERPGVSVPVISRPVGLDSVLIVVVRRVIVLGMVRMLGTAGH